MKPYLNQEIRYINWNAESKLSTVSAYIKEFLRKIEIENKTFHIYSKWKTPIEVFPDKMIMYLSGLHIYNSPRQIDHQKCSMLAKYTIVLDDVF